MKNILIVLLVVALALILLGVANNSHAVDLHYIVGTWHHVSVLLLTALLAALIVVITLSAVVVERARAWRVRRKLEQELDRTYSRLRDAEAALAAAAGQPAAAASAASASTSDDGPPAGVGAASDAS